MRPRTSTSLDWMTLSLFLGLVGVGWLMIFTVGHGKDGYSWDLSEFMQTPIGKQTIWVGISALVFIATQIIEWKFWRTFSYLIYAITIISLVGVPFLGKTINNATSWYAIGSFTIQPSELAKFGTCLAVASYLSTYSTDMRYLRSQVISVLMILAPMLLILLQPDAGSALVFMSFFIVFYRAGFSENILVLAASAGALLILGLVNSPIHILLWMSILGLFFLISNLRKEQLWWFVGAIILTILTYVGITQKWPVYFVLGNVLFLGAISMVQWKKRRERIVTIVWGGIFAAAALTFTSNFAFNNLLGDHQQERIKVWLKPADCDPQGAAYNLVHSKMAIGSGGFEGKGFLQGNLTQGRFVPEQITDFIFCTVGEEQGFIGSFGVIVLFLLLMMRIVTIAERQANNFSKYYAYSVAGILFIHVLINIGMTMGVMPIIGIPLPFISKGGSALLGFTIMIGVLLKLDASRYVA